MEVVIVVHVFGGPAEHASGTSELALGVGLGVTPDGVAEALWIGQDAVSGKRVS